MKLVYPKKEGRLLFLIMAIFILFVSHNPLISLNLEEPSNSLNSEVRASDVDSESISISGDDEIAQYASNGDGSDWDHAYIIEERAFHIRNSTPAIFIANTSDYIILRRFSVGIVAYDNTSSSWVGLYIKNCSNIKMEYGFFTALRMSGTAIHVEDSYGINFTTYNTLRDFYYGVRLINTSESSFSNINIHDCRFAYFYLDQCVDNIFFSNKIWKTDIESPNYGGFYLTNCSKNIIKENEIQGMSDGIYSSNSKENIYRENTLEKTSVFYYESENEIIEGNTFESNQNSLRTISVMFSSQIIIRKNHLRYTGVNAILVVDSYHVLIEKNTFYRGAGYALYIYKTGEFSEKNYNTTIKGNTYFGVIKGIINYYSNVECNWGWNWYFPQFGYLISAFGIFIVMWILVGEMLGIKHQGEKLKEFEKVKEPANEILALSQRGIFQIHQLDKLKFQRKIAKVFGIFSFLLLFSHTAIYTGGRYLDLLFEILNDGESVSGTQTLLQNLANILLLGSWIGGIWIIIKIFRPNSSHKIVSIIRKEELSKLNLWVKIALCIIFVGLYVLIWFLSNFIKSPYILCYYGIMMLALYLSFLWIGFKPKENLIILFSGLLLIIAGIYGSAIENPSGDYVNPYYGEFKFTRWIIFLIWAISAILIGTISSIKMDDTEQSKERKING